MILYKSLLGSCTRRMMPFLEEKCYSYPHKILLGLAFERVWMAVLVKLLQQLVMRNVVVTLFSPSRSGLLNIKLPGRGGTQFRQTNHFIWTIQYFHQKWHESETLSSLPPTKNTCLTTSTESEKQWQVNHSFTTEICCRHRQEQTQKRVLQFEKRYILCCFQLAALLGPQTPPMLVPTKYSWFSFCERGRMRMSNVLRRKEFLPLRTYMCYNLILLWAKFTSSPLVQIISFIN